MTNKEMREKLTTVANIMTELAYAIAEFAADDEHALIAAQEKEEAAPAAEPVKKYTMEDVRRVLAAKSAAGFTSQVRELLLKHGASKLSAVKESEYAAIMEEVKTIGSTQ